MSALTTFAPSSLAEAKEFSNLLAGSGMVPQNYQGKPADIMVAVMWGYELQLQPLQALQNISVINGKPSVWGDAAIALVRRHHACAGVKEWIDGEGDQMIAYCEVKRAHKGKDDETITSSFSMADARQAGLLNKKGPWSQYPKRMLQMRARGFALRDAFPDALKGVIATEEAMDYPEDQMKDVTPVAANVDQIGDTVVHKDIDAVVSQVADTLRTPDAKVTAVKPHGTALAEHMETWQSLTVTDLKTIEKDQLVPVLKRWRDEAGGCVNLCTTPAQLAEVEKRFQMERSEIASTSAAFRKWAEKAFEEFSERFAEKKSSFAAAQTADGTPL
jgi:hypothetical protein